MGAFLGAPAIWILPIVFPIVMVIGGVLGIMGLPVPFVETSIALSAVVLGLLVAAASRPPIWFAAIIVAAFAIFHGHAHEPGSSPNDGRDSCERTPCRI